MPHPPLTLSASSLELELSPSIGGAISNFSWTGGGGRTPILRECHNPLENVLDAACFPLVPFSNRIRGGCFRFRDKEVRLTPNMAGDPSPLHGQGWMSAWEVESVSGGEATLVFDHQAGEWPWSYRAVQGLRLEGDCLNLRLSCTNMSKEPMPCGLGFHPYFRCGPETRIQTAVSQVWTVDEHVLPVEKVPAKGRFDLKRRLVCGQGLDNGFDNWGGLAWIGDPGWPFDLLLSSRSAGFFQLYSPVEVGIFVAEPVTHANAALNAPEEDWPELGMRVIEPGGALSLDMRLEVVPK